MFDEAKKGDRIIPNFTNVLKRLERNIQGLRIAYDKDLNLIDKFYGYGFFIDNQHIGHHLWNNLSALEILSLNDKLKIDSLFWITNEPTFHFGEITKLYNRDFNFIRYSNAEDLNAKCIEKGVVPISVVETYISKSLSTRILNYSVNKEMEYLASLNLNKYDIRFLVNFRCDNRSWINQIEEVTALVKALRCNYNYKILLVVDGWNKGENDKINLSTGKKSDIENKANSAYCKEIDLFNRLAERISTYCDTVNNIGCKVSRSIAVCESVDYYIAPWGAALSKYAWVCNTPGVVASNKYMYSDPEFQIYFSPKYVEKNTIVYPIDKNFIEGDSNKSRSSFYTKKDTLINLFSEKIMSL